MMIRARGDETVQRSAAATRAKRDPESPSISVTRPPLKEDAWPLEYRSRTDRHHPPVSKLRKLASRGSSKGRFRDC